MFVEGFRRHAPTHHLQDVSKVAYIHRKQSGELPDTLPENDQPTQRHAPTKCGPPYKGIIRYGEPINLSTCIQDDVFLTASQKSVQEFKSARIAKLRSAWRSSDTKKARRYISWELDKADNQLSLKTASEVVWFGSTSENSELVILPTRIGEDTRLGDPVRYQCPVLILQASSFGGRRYMLEISDDGCRVVPAFRLLDCTDAPMPPPYSKWIFTKVSEQDSREPVCHQDVVALISSDSGHQLCSVPCGTHKSNDLGFELALSMDVAAMHSETLFWQINSILTEHLPVWRHHLIGDATVPTPIEMVIPTFFETSVCFSQESLSHILLEDNTVDLGVQEILLVEDILHCLLGVSGEFITLHVDYPERESHSLEPREVKQAPRFYHTYNTFLQRNPQLEGLAAKFIKLSDDRAKDESNNYDSLYTLDESLRKMADKIMELVHDVALIRHVSLWHTIGPTTRTNEALGTAICYVLKEFTDRTSEIEAWSGKHSLSLQKLWSFLHATKPAILILARIARETYGVCGLRLVDIVMNVRDEFASSEHLKSVMTFVVLAVCQPLEQILNDWLLKGNLSDPRGEFFIAENPRLTDSNSELRKWLFWKYRFQLISDSVPTTLKAFENQIAEIGRAWNVFALLPDDERRACRSILDDFQIEPFLIESPSMPSKILQLHGLIMDGLYKIIVVDRSLPQRLESFHRFFLQSRSDLLADFMELVPDEMSSSNPHLDAISTAWSQALEVSTLRQELWKRDVSAVCVKTSLVSMTRWIDPAWCVSDGQTSPVDCRSFYAPATSAEKSLALSFSSTAFIRSSGLVVDHADYTLARVMDLTTVSPTARLKHTFADAPPDPTLKGFQMLTLMLKLEWPLHLIIDMDSLIAYQIAFRFLFQLRHTYFRITRLWQVLSRLSRDGSESVLLSRCLHIQRRMALFLSKIMTYVVDEVYETQRSKFSNIVLPQETTLAGLVTAHSKFLANILQEVLFTQSDMFRTLVSSVDLIRTFCGFAEQIMTLPELAANPLGLSDIDLPQLDTRSHLQMADSFTNKFQEDVRTFVEAVSQLSLTTYGGHTRRLLLRLDCCRGIPRSISSVEAPSS